MSLLVTVCQWLGVLVLYLYAYWQCTNFCAIGGAGTWQSLKSGSWKFSSFFAWESDGWHLPHTSIAMVTGKGSHSRDLTSGPQGVHQQGAVQRGICGVSHCTLGLAWGMAWTVPDPDGGTDQWQWGCSTWCHAGTYRSVSSGTQSACTVLWVMGIYWNKQKKNLQKFCMACSSGKATSSSEFKFCF